MDCSPPSSSVRGISQARILKWVAISFFRVSSRPRDQTCISCIGRQIDSLLLGHQRSPRSMIRKTLMTRTLRSLELLCLYWGGRLWLPETSLCFTHFIPLFLILRKETGLLGLLDCKFLEQKREVRIWGGCECQREGDPPLDWGASGDCWVCCIVVPLLLLCPHSRLALRPWTEIVVWSSQQG